MKTRQALPTALVLASLLGTNLACRPEVPLARPDVLVILIDCLRADHVGAYGYHRATTPNLDALAAEGLVFENAFAQSHWTRPSVPTLLTGLYPSEHGMLEVEYDEKGRVVGPALSDEVQTLSESMLEAGYKTALFAEQYQLAKTFNLHQGFETYNNRSGPAANLNRSFLRWLDKQDANDQVFAYLHYLDIHWPYCPTDWARGKFDPGESNLSVCKDWRQLRAQIRSGQLELSEADVERITARYDEELVQLDDYLGKLFAALAERGRWDETLVLVTADHGEEFMERGSIGHHTGLSEALIHVPLVAKAPRSWTQAKAGRDDALVELRSIPPTVLEAAGEDPGRGGPSLVPNLLGRSDSQGSTFIVAENSYQIGVRTMRHKLLFERDTGAIELFDVKADPLGLSDQAATQPETVADLTAHLRRWRSSLAAIEPVRKSVDSETVEGLKDLGYID